MQKAYSYIRFSSPKQIEGDSLRRQLERSQEYADAHSLDLDTSMRDLGLSGYSGEHREKGALGIFIDLVARGKIAKGSVLIVENLDRLSREQVGTALTQFINMLSSGIEIVTLMDGKHYTEASLNDLGSLMMSTMIMHRAWEESATKSDRGNKVWTEKRESGKVLTRKCPNWLTVKEDMTGFIVDERKAADIRRIFDMSISGIGSRKISTILNEESVVPHGKTEKTFKPWNEPYIRSLLTNRALIGEVQFYSKGEAVGDPVADYYPRVIDDRTFYRAQAAIADRRGKGGKRSKTFTNIFSGICKCAKCGETYRLISHKKAQSEYYTCSSYYAKSGCSNDKRWRRRFVEAAALIMMSDRVDWFEKPDETESLNRLNSDLLAEQERLKTHEAKADRYATMYAETGFDDALSRYKTSMNEVAACKASISGINAVIKAYNPSKDVYDSYLDAVNALAVTTDEDELYALRARINSIIKQADVLIEFNTDKVDLLIGGDIRETLLTAENEETVGNGLLIAFEHMRKEKARGEMALT